LDNQGPCAAGTGEIDFDAIKPCLTSEIPITVELKPGPNEEDIQKSLVFMKIVLDS
jgi:hypothetical protein